MMADTPMKWNELVECALEFDRNLVGVSFVQGEQELAKTTVPVLRNRVPYCVLIKLGTLGYSRIALLDHFGCMAAARAFGMTEPTAEWLSGCQYAERGMYRDVETARKVVANTTNMNGKPIGVMVKPLKEWESPPDVVIIVTSPYNMMRLVQGYTHQYGTYKNFKLIGNQAFCSECTAYPMESGEINLSVLCAGTRHMAGWGKEEMGLGIPYEKFCGMAEGLYHTINPMETREGKLRAAEKFQAAGRNNVSLDYEKNYFTGLYRT